ncbi:MAG: hypothetical protein ACOYEH_02395 [Caldicoprobacterales bacterium]|nr:hypothetical protein [Clostridiales bacterium]
MKKINTNKQATNGQKKKIRYMVNIAVVIALAILFFIGTRPPQVEVTENYVKISGMYGVELPTKDIQTLELRDTMPKIQARTNGMDLFGFARRGIYQLEGLGRTRLISFSYGGPFIFMYTGNEWIIINFKNPADTEDLFYKLEQAAAGQ